MGVTKNYLKKYNIVLPAQICTQTLSHMVQVWPDRSGQSRFIVKINETHQNSGRKYGDPKLVYTLLDLY